MEYTAIASLITGIGAAIITLSLALMLIRWIRLELSLYRSSRANTETSPALAYSKDPEVGYLPQGRGGSSVHRITFHTDSGDIVTLCMGPRDYYAIEEGARGILTWQGTRFWSFQQDTP